VVLDEEAAGLPANPAHYRWVEDKTLDWQQYE
jgi:hypothetical protein